MTYDEMMNSLCGASDPTYVDYQRKIVIDTAYPMLFVRMPVVRKIAREVSKGDWKGIANCCSFSCYEEVLTICLAIAGADAELSERLHVLKPLLTRLDSWAMTDSIVPTLAVRPDERAIAWEFAMDCIRSEGAYVRRFGIVLLLDFFLIPEYLDDVEETIVSIRDQRYYVQMACAWLLAEMAVRDWHRVEEILKNSALNAFAHNMTIRKIRESFRIPQDVKAAAAAMKRKDVINV